MDWKAKIPSAGLIWNGFLRVMMNALNRYETEKWFRIELGLAEYDDSA